jgi:Tfp pilus assembly protein PilO
MCKEAHVTAKNLKADDMHWSLDKKVPLALILTVIIQTIGVSWWAATLSGQVNYLENRVTKAEATMEREALSSRLASDRLIRVEEGVKAILDLARRREDDALRERRP